MQTRGGATDEAALLARLGNPAPGSLPAAAGKNPYAIVIAEGEEARHLRCASGSRAADAVKLHDAGNAWVLSFACRGAALDGGLSDPAKQGGFDVVMRKGEKGPLAAGSGPRKLLPGDAALDAKRSRGWAELEGCLNAFDQYRKDLARPTFDVKVVAGYPRCTAGTGSLIVLSPIKPEPIVVSFPGAMEVARFGPYSRTKNPNGEDVFTLHPVLWRNDWNGAKIGIITAGSPMFNAVRVAPYTGIANMVATCENWQQLPGLLVGPTLALAETRKAYPEEVAQLTLGDIASPYISFVSLENGVLDAMKGSLPAGGSKLGLRLIPLYDKRPEAAYCIGRPTPPLEVNFGTSPVQQASAQVTAGVQAWVALENAKKQAKLQAEAARNKLFAGQNPADRAPLRVELVSWEPPFGGSVDSNTTLIMTSIPDRGGELEFGPPPASGPRKTTDFTLDEALRADLVWPERSGWAEGCSFDPYYFVQAAQHKANPNGVLDWILLTLNSYAGLYKMLQNFVVEGFAYVTTGGACPFNDPTKPASDSGACKSYKSVAKMALKGGMAAIGAPAELPSSNDVVNMGADYVATTAVDYMLGAEVSAYIPDSVRQKATGTISEAVRKTVLGASCAQPLRPGDDPKQHGYDGVDPVTLCGYKVGSPYNHVRRDTWSDGHPRNAVAWLRVTHNPNGIRVDPRVKIDVTATFVKPPSFPAWLAGAVPEWLQPFGSVKSVTIDARNVPAKGMLVPVVLPYDESGWKFILNKTNGCPDDAFRPQCISDRALNEWRQVLKNPVRIAANVDYTWTADSSATTSCAFAQGVDGKPVQICSTAPANVRSAAVTIEGPPGRVFEGRMETFPKYKPCPGFKLYAPDPVTGIQTGHVKPDFDMDAL